MGIMGNSMVSDEDILGELKSACANLNYPSESDEPFVVFRWNATEPEAWKQIQFDDKLEGLAWTETSVDDFFSQLDESEDAIKFQRLRRLLEIRLTNLRLFRFGEIEVKVYLVGLTPAGSWAGVRTISVET